MEGNLAINGIQGLLGRDRHFRAYRRQPVFVLSGKRELGLQERDNDVDTLPLAELCEPIGVTFGINPRGNMKLVHRVPKNLFLRAVNANDRDSSAVSVILQSFNNRLS